MFLRLIRTTVTDGGFKVYARLTRKIYRTGIRVSNAEMELLNLTCSITVAARIVGSDWVWDKLCRVFVWGEQAES